MNKYFLEWLETHTDSFVDDHLETWKDHYYRHSLDYIENELKLNYDWSGDIEWCETGLNRELTDEERDYLVNYFTEKVVNDFYLD